jgi:hypothetical protein
VGARGEPGKECEYDVIRFWSVINGAQDALKLYVLRATFTHKPRAVTMKIVRATKKVSKGHPNTPPRSYIVVVDSQV